MRLELSHNSIETFFQAVIQYIYSFVTSIFLLCRYPLTAPYLLYWRWRNPDTIQAGPYSLLLIYIFLLMDGFFTASDYPSEFFLSFGEAKLMGFEAQVLFSSALSVATADVILRLSSYSVYKGRPKQHNRYVQRGIYALSFVAVVMFCFYLIMEHLLSRLLDAPFSLSSTDFWVRAPRDIVGVIAVIAMMFPIVFYTRRIAKMNIKRKYSRALSAVAYFLPFLILYVFVECLTYLASKYEPAVFPIYTQCVEKEAGILDVESVLENRSSDLHIIDTSKLGLVIFWTDKEERSGVNSDRYTISLTKTEPVAQGKFLVLPAGARVFLLATSGEVPNYVRKKVGLRCEVGSLHKKILVDKPNGLELMPSPIEVFPERNYRKIGILFFRNGH